MTTRLALGRPLADGVVHRVWRAMGCRAEVQVVAPDLDRHGGELLTRLAVGRVAALEQAWTRFSPSSELSMLNRSAGRVCTVSRDTVRLIEAMASGWAATGGAFDPTLLAPLVGLGYGPPVADVAAPTRVATCSAVLTDITVDRDRCRVALPPGLTIDAGGIGKGLAADIVATELVSAGASSAMVSLGGDLRIAHAALSQNSEPWEVCVERPDGDGVMEAVAVLGGGVATSGTTVRRWQHDGAEVHHVIDPRTHRPTDIGLHSVVQATVIAGTAAWAEVLATAAVVDGAIAAVMDRDGVATMVVRGDGSYEVNGAWVDLRSATTIGGRP